MYLAPEVLSGTFSKACDIFSLGVTLLELATDMDLPRSGQLWHDLRTRGPDPALTTALQPELRRENERGIPTLCWSPHSSLPCPTMHLYVATLQWCKAAMLQCLKL